MEVSVLLVKLTSALIAEDFTRCLLESQVGISFVVLSLEVRLLEVIAPELLVLVVQSMVIIVLWLAL